ncbi:MAG: diguanylate cyclase [Candidatus Brocadiia bacterium]
MGLIWHESDAEEELATGRIYRSGRRALLAVLLAAVLSFVLAIFLGQTNVYLGMKIMAWALCVWSGVTVAYSALVFLRARRYHRHRTADLGLTDVLTGLPNRKGLVAALDRMEGGPKEFGKRIRLIDIDLSNLERVNYEFGQMVGDAVLQDIASLLEAKVPPDHVVGRLGGDEFLVVMPQASVSEAEALADSLERAVADYTLSLGDRGEVHSLKASVSVAAYVPEQASLHETVVSAKTATAHGKLPASAGGDEGEYYHIPRITLGAFAAHRWQNLQKSEQDAYKQWKRELTEDVTERMRDDIARMLDEKAETRWADFVTAVPVAGGAGGGRTYAARELAEAVAGQLGVAYRDVMRADSSAGEERTVEPAVDAVIEKGDCVLLISDVVSSGIVERRCVKKLAAAGAHVQVAAWAAY